RRSEIVPTAQADIADASQILRGITWIKRESHWPYVLAQREQQAQADADAQNQRHLAELSWRWREVLKDPDGQQAKFHRTREPTQPRFEHLALAEMGDPGAGKQRQSRPQQAWQRRPGEKSCKNRSLAFQVNA